MTGASREPSDEPAGPALAVERLSKAFGTVRAVDEVSFAVAPGEFLTLLGPSGSGKTTILRLLGGFEYPDFGTIVLGGAVVNRVPPYRRMTVEENIAFPLRQRKVPAEERVRQTAGALELVGLEGLGGRYPRQLSGGQQQRVALARAIVFKPEILLMDEPLGALDKKLRERMQREIRALQQRVGITAVYVTHDQSEAMTMSDKIAVIHDGRIEQLGVPDELYERPATEFVAGFVGDSNIIEGSVLDRDGEMVGFRFGEGAVVRFPWRDGLGERAMLLVRPEKLRLQESNAEVGRSLNRVRGRIRDVTYVGEATLYDVEAAGTGLTIRQPNRDGVSRAHVGDAVEVVWSPNDCAAVL